jgi:two-component system cell cycle response regulator
VGGHDAFVATANHGIFVLEGAGRSVSIRAGTGRFEGLILLDGLTPGLRAAVDAGLEASGPFAHPEGYVVVPLRTNAGERGCMVITSPSLPAESTEACAIFATQVVQSIENNLLYARATVDPLTEAHTRDFGFRRLADTIAVETQHGIPTTVLMVDIDHFKQVNDRYGHAAGDLALRTVTRAIRGACRQGDVVSRYGGEEFLVVLPATPLERARIVAERIRLATNSLDFYFEGASIPLTVSVGLATGPDSADRIVRRADRALYQAKANGRNQVVEADEAAAAARAA